MPLLKGTRHPKGDTFRMDNWISNPLTTIEPPIWIYWGFCLLALLVIVVKRRFIYHELLNLDSNSSPSEMNYTLFLSLGWFTTLLAGVSYILLTHKLETGPYVVSDMLVFVLLNGALEQFMFVFWFLVGCYIGKIIMPGRPILIFISGYISYALFSGLIHGLFWIAVLPSHQPSMVVPFVLAITSLIWMWLYWRYRALAAGIAMHIIIDLLTIGHLHFSWFERFQIV
jgi:chlorophyllide a hydrolase